MRGRILYSFLGLLVFSMLQGSQAYGQTGSDAVRKLELLKAYPDVVVVNGKIHTMDARLRQVQAMTIKNNRILALGTNDEIRFLAGPNTEMIDAKGRVVLPALVDSHTHPMLWSVQHWLGARGQDIAKEYNMPELASVLVRGNDAPAILRGLEQAARQRAQILGSGKWIVAFTFAGEGKTLEDWDRIKLSGGITPVLTREFLDSIAPNNPMIVFTGGGTLNNVHNTKAVEEWKKIVGHEQTAGLMAGPHFFWHILLRGRDDVATAIMKRELLECIAAHGVGTFSDRYDRGPESARIMRLLYERGELPVRWGYVVSVGANLVTQKYEHSYDKATLTDFFVRIFPNEVPDLRGIGNDYIWNAGTANEGWEEGVSCTKAEPPPPNAPKPQWGFELRRNCNTDPPDLEKSPGYVTARATLESGRRMGFMHGYSDGTYDAMFKMIEDAIAAGKVTLEQVRAMRISTEHNPIMRPDQIEKFAKYNFMLSFEGYQVQGDIKGGAFLKTYGEKYMNWIAPLKSLVNAGVHVSFSTDAHLTDSGPEWKSMEMAEQWRSGIWAYMEFFLTRDMPHDDITYNKAEAIDKVTLMKAATIWGAERLINEKNIGSLEVGKLADFQVIDKDYFTIPEDQIHTIKTLLTSVGGKIVYRAPNY